MLFEFNQMIVDIDVEATRKYYKQAEMINDCSCSGCRNYRQNMEQCNNNIKEFFSSLGIDNMNFITEIIPLDVSRDEYDKEHCIAYTGFYHIVGRIIENKKTKHEQEWIKLDTNFAVIVHDDIDFLPDGFPKPYLQVDISVYVPWVLDEHNEYII